MSLWDALCDNVLCPMGESIGAGLCTLGRGIDKAVNVVVIDGVCAGLDNTIDYVKENPVKSVAIATTTIASGGLATLAAPTIAGALGSSGVLGLASTGTAINTLSGIALSNASLATLGGGAMSAGGGGVILGTAVVTSSGAVVGASTSTLVSSIVEK
tara:strand:+ start:2752 stop:3222 length:471 start_codon:yes stop_codon:yes gene_type:complete